MNLPPVPPPATRDKSRPPPRPAKASIHQQQLQLQHESNSRVEPSTSQQARYLSQQQPLLLQQQHFSQTDNYVGLSLIPNIVDVPAAAAAAAAITPTRQKTQPQHNQLLVSDAEHTPTTIAPQQQARHHHAHQQQHQSARRLAPTTPTSTSTSPSASTLHSITSQHTPTQNSINHQAADIDELVDYADVADSIRGLSATGVAAAAAAAATVVDSAMPQRSASHENLLRTEPQFQKLSPEKYDQMVGNFALGGAKAVERHMQQHADDIELYVDPCDYASLREIGLPPEELHELSKKLKQEQKDEVHIYTSIPNTLALLVIYFAFLQLLARRLQAIESKDSALQEQRDRMLAIEAQDKELAKMLQERVS